MLFRVCSFRIALRHITAEPETIDASLTSLRENGFINYYGLQRFGNNAAIPTHQVGLALLRGKFDEAVELILKPRDGDVPFMTNVREHWWKHRDAEAALKMLFKSNKGVEAKLLAGLAKNGGSDYVNSLANVSAFVNCPKVGMFLIILVRFCRFHEICG